MEKVNPAVLAEVKKLGAFDLEACFSCGNCSAICPLSREAASFPRRMIRYALLGLEKRLLSAPEPWLCYYCGECSETCPRQAEPASLMMALRRFATRRYALGRAADAVYSSLGSLVTWLALSAVALVLVLLAREPRPDMTRFDFQSFIRLEPVHIGGLVLIAFIAAVAAIQVAILYRNLRGAPGAVAAIRARAAGASVWQALREAVMQNRFGECSDDRLRRLAHMGVSWGFMGMLLATIIIGAVDFGWLPWPRWVSLAVGSVSGIACASGLAYYLYLRLARRTEVGKYSHSSDWAFLLLLALSVLSGFAVVAFRFLGLLPAAYVTVAVHIVFVFDLLVTFPFSKFAHVVYRPLALFLAGLK